MTLVVKSSPASVGDAKDAGSTPGSGRSPGGGMEDNCSVLAWSIPVTGEPVGLQSIGLRRVGHDGSNLALRFFDGNLFL